MAIDNGGKLGQLAPQEDGCQLRRESTALAGTPEGGDDAGGGDVYQGAELVPVWTVGRAPVGPEGRRHHAPHLDLAPVHQASREGPQVPRQRERLPRPGADPQIGVRRRREPRTGGTVPLGFRGTLPADGLLDGPVNCESGDFHERMPPFHSGPISVSRTRAFLPIERHISSIM